VIPGMQARVLTTAATAPTLAIAVNASAYQVAAAFAGWLGGRVVAGPGLPAIYVVAAGTTVLGALLTAVALRSHASTRLTNSRKPSGAENIGM